MPSTFGLAKASTSASIPIWRKKIGMNRWPTGASSERMRSADVVRASASPATNAPMIGARSAACASSASTSVNASAAATSVPPERL